MVLDLSVNNNIGSGFNKFRHTNAENKQAVNITADTEPAKNIKTSKTTGKEHLANAAGLITGITAPAYIVYDSLRKVSANQAHELADVMQNLLPATDTLEHTKETAEKILEASGLKAKGVGLNFINDSIESQTNLRDIISRETGSHSIFNNRLSNNYFNIFNEGGNAGFFPKTNNVVVSEKGLYDTVYHELGHAMNKNGNIITKLLQKSRCLTPFGASVIAPIALGVALFHKVDETKPKDQKNFIEKSLDFVSKHAVSITAASYIPMLTEEGLASIRGLKMASKYLQPDKIKKLGWNYTKAWSTYAGTAALITAGVWAGIKLKNYIIKTDMQTEK